MSNSIIIVIPTELLREIWLNSRGVGSKSFQHWSNLLAASPLTDPNIKQITFNRSSKASPKSSEGSVIRKKKKSFLFAFLETTWSNVFLEFRLSPGAFWEAWVYWGQCRGFQVSCQLSDKERGKFVQNTPWTQTKHRCDVYGLYMQSHPCAHVYVLADIYFIYICKAKNLKSTSGTALLGRMCLWGDWSLLFMLLLQGRLEGFLLTLPKISVIRLLLI